ncbi:hypothetical protein C1N32_20595 [Vibrio diazotrophicus]|uniref:Uncharacterized protein n=1 Tax=Vibrio diazotrophicus TaxID=685 RepID=A0A2J8HSA8_VIBDI|nr:hypothetical protein [Vibrio diazotrophicus]PNI01164.1 hypothetical protein C1N32_20595 [Vibrio diazotrophicus]
MAVKKTATKAETASTNAPQEYEVLKKFRFLGKFHQIGAVLTLKPSQAQLFVYQKKLKLKGAN